MSATTIGRRLGCGVAVVGAFALVAASGCKTSDSRDEKTIVVPSAATSTPAYEGDGSIPDERYVIRMSDGTRDWEVQFPSNGSAYEMQIPLEGKPREGEGMRWEGDQLTEADKELLEHLRRQNPEMEREGAYRGDENVLDREARREGDGEEGESAPDEGASDGREETTDGEETQGEKEKRSESDPAPTRPSYLMGIEKVRNLYRNGKYELAMIRLQKLEEAYPDDVQILSMKGTLWLKLGREKLARRAWERVLQIDRDNRQVREALQRLKESDSDESSGQQSEPQQLENQSE